MSTPNRTLSNAGYLRRIRLSAGLSLRALGERLGYSAPYLSDVERGLRHANAPIVALYEKLADEFRRGAA